MSRTSKFTQDEIRAACAEHRGLSSRKIESITGISRTTVTEYRRAHPELAYDPPKSVLQHDKAPELGIGSSDRQRPYSGLPTRSVVFDNWGLRANRVSLPLEPWEMRA